MVCQWNSGGFSLLHSHSLTLALSLSLSIALLLFLYGCVQTCVCVYLTKKKREPNQQMFHVLLIFRLPERERLKEDDVFSSLLGSDVFVKCSIQLAIIWKQVKFDHDDDDDDRWWMGSFPRLEGKKQERAEQWIRQVQRHDSSWFPIRLKQLGKAEALKSFSNDES